MSSTRPLALCALLLASLSAAACATGGQRDAAVKAELPRLPTEQYKVRTEDRPEELLLGLKTGALSENQHAALADYAARWRANAASPVVIEAASTGGADAYNTSHAAADTLVRYGVPASEIRIVGYEADARAPVRVSFLSPEIVIDQCGRSWDRLTKTGSNGVPLNFGCAVTANRAAMIANAADIHSPRALDPVDAARRQTVLDKYRRGEVTSSARDDQASGDCFPRRELAKERKTVIKPALEDDFELGFDAEDDFTPAAAPAWDEPLEASRDPYIADPYAAPDFPADPFAGLDPVRPRESRPERQILEEEVYGAAPAQSAAASPQAQPQPLPAGAEAAVPRIAIHIFCERPDTAAIADQAAADRRMSRATTLVRPGGLAGAVEHYRNQPTPSLVIVESQDPPPVLIGLLDQLAEVCDPGTKVVVIGRANDIALYRELMKRGVSEYLVPPLAPLQLIQSVTNLYSDPSAPFIGRSIAFVGAKGGVGASTIAHNFAHAITEFMQANAVIVDFDLPFGTAGLDFNQDPLQGVADALSQPDRLDPVLLERMMARCTDRLSLFAAPATLDDDYDISAEAFDEVASKIRNTAPFVILDLPHLWSGWMRKMLVSGDELIVVATPDLASLRNAKNIFDLVRTARPNDQPPRLVLNQVGVPGRPEIPTKDFGDALGVSPSLILPFDPKLFGQAANNGQMVAEVQPKSKSAEGINQLARLISRREPPQQAKKSLLGGLFKGK